MSRSVLSRAGLLAMPVLALFLLSSCTVSLFPFLGESASQLATNAAANWDKAGAHHIQAAYATSGMVVTTDEMIATHGGAATGSGTANGKAYQLLDVNGKMYLKGQSFWQAYYAGDASDQELAKGFQENWTVADSNRVAEVDASLSDLDQLVSLLAKEAKQVKKGQQRTYHGQPMTQLTDGRGHTWWTTEGSTGQVVELVSKSLGQAKTMILTAGTAQTPRGLADRLTKPVVNPGDPSTLPARYSALDQHEPGSCDQNGCPIDVTVENMGGAAAGQGVVTVTAFKDQSETQAVTSCKANIPGNIPTNQSGTATCTLAGSAWSAFVSSAPNGGTFYVGIAVTTNPPYV